MYIFLTTTGSIQDSSAGTMTRLHAGQLRDHGLISGNGKIPQYPDWLWTHHAYSQGLKEQNHAADHSFQLVVRLRNCGDMPPFPHMPPECSV
jgi:hypothetical protein